jgi:hypothetical protein
MWDKSEVLLGTSWGHFGKPMGTSMEHIENGRKIPLPHLLGARI